MLISIIIPTLNEEEHIGSLLEFLTSHPQKDQFEVIVVDGHSTDQTISIVESFKIPLFKSNPCSRARQMNEGATRAEGEVLYFVHADVQLVPTFVNDIYDAVSRGIQSGCYRFKFEQPTNPLLHINGFFTRFPFKWCRGGDQTLFIAKEVFKRINGFDERFVIMEDYDLLDRIESHGISFEVIPKSIKVSARKYELNSYLKVQLANLKAMKMYKKGINPAEIKKFYSSTLN
ncbi:TIGR04283 family arsenosugar biosynthesis glycosyltransferase [Ekhidna sp.]|uniref:TIGR04283 family arsenosugar biosynthesis glycosyltransferase n=1 Tax=Ekhidna sp. TaxID=2608089 RepID=UPI00329703FF